ncbi:hypothetical protein AB0F92_29120 [Kitasatospora aureofaciens]|uniref:hypothetical protein n=1 Tax=Kitasatospora aureofaciens TaxID=1894 RepID=UPI003407FDB9
MNVDSTICRPHQHAAGARRDGAAQKEPPGGVGDEPADHGAGPVTGRLQDQGRALALAHYTAIAHQVRKTQLVTATAEAPEPDRPRLRIAIDQRPQRTA